MQCNACKHCSGRLSQLVRALLKLRFLVAGLRAVFGEVYPNPVREVSVVCPVEQPLAKTAAENDVYAVGLRAVFGQVYSDPVTVVSIECPVQGIAAKCNSRG